jgi:hypothetical protein
MANRWTFRQMDRASAIIFADLTDDILAGTAPALSDERMTAINMLWFETLARAGWTQAEWDTALDCRARIQTRLEAAYQAGYRAGVKIGVDQTIEAYDELLQRRRHDANR